MIFVFNMVEVLRLWANRSDLLEDLRQVEETLTLERDEPSPEGDAPRAVLPEKPKTVEDQLGADGVAQLIAEYRDGVIGADLAERYKISLSSVRRLLRKYGGRLKDKT